MALFHVNRYMGIDSPLESKSSGDILLQKLHDKAKAREKQRAQGGLKTPSPAAKKNRSQGAVDLKDSLTKKLKIRGERQEPSPTVEDRTQNESTKSALKDKSKRSKDSKKRKVTLDTEISSNRDTQVHSSIEKIKKKKHKTHDDSGSQASKKTKDKNLEIGNISTDNAEIKESHENDLKLKKNKRKEKKHEKADESDLTSSPNGQTGKGGLSKPKPNHKHTKSHGKDQGDRMEVDDEEKHVLSSKERQGSSPSSSEEEEEEEEEMDMSPSKEKQDSFSFDDDAEEEKEEEEEEDVGFTILGEVEEQSKKKVMRVLPEWLSQPTIVEHDLTHNQVAVGDYPLISPKIAAALKQNNITHLFPVQRHVIPIILDSVKFGLHAGDAGYRPRDLCVSAPTGSGKTLAFAVPVVQALHDRVVPRIRALAVLPTRDLANQVYRVFAMLCNAVNLRAVLLGGQKSFDKEQEMLTKHSHSAGIQVDIVVATPGRLVDHINNTKGFTLEHLRFLVIDEADRMMEQISKDWISQVEKSAYPGKSAPLGIASIMQARPKPGPVTLASCAQMYQPLQKLLFSATLSQNPEKLTHLNLFQPRLVTTLVTKGQQRRLIGQQEVTDEEQEEKGEFVGKYTTPVGLTEFYIQCGKGYKPLVVLHLMKRLYCRQVLCFTNTVEATHRLYLLVKIVGGVNVAEFSSNLKPAERQQILKQFKAGKIDLLICSDAMARGMDLDNVRFVISYGLPPYLKTYIHRIGRTARAGKPGIALSLLQQSEVPMFKSMLKNAGKPEIEKHAVRPGDLHPLMMDYEDALDQLPHILKKEKERS